MLLLPSERGILTSSCSLIDIVKLHTQQRIQKVSVPEYIDQSIKENGLTPWFQPIVNSEGNPVKYEALVRGIGLNGELLMPDQLLEINQESNQEQWEDYYRKLLLTDFNIGLSINVDSHLLESETYTQFITGQDHKTKDLHFEILETMSHQQAGVEHWGKIQQLRDSGHKLGMDDFPQEYSSLGREQYLSPNFVKFDGSVLQGLDTSQMKFAVIKALIQSFRKRAIHTVFERVETTQEFELLKRMGVDHFQGYLFGRAIPFHQIKHPTLLPQF